MRYYNFILGTSSEQIEKNDAAKVNLKPYRYEDSTLSGVNAYLYRNLDNNMCFFVYREEEQALYAAFTVNEQKVSFEQAFEHLTGTLREALGIRKILKQPYEVTMFQFLDCYNECKRRSYSWSASGRVTEACNLFIYYTMQGVAPSDNTLHYEFTERIVPEKMKKVNGMYDRKFVEELRNIENHAAAEEYKGNPVHYIIAARSMEAAEDMTETLMQRLLSAGRLRSRRLEIITDMHPEVYRGRSYLEDIIENNEGGAIIFDLSEKLGTSPTEYGETAGYLEQLVKRYHNRCLFVFMYNMDHPGFSYSLLPNLRKYVLPMQLKEGSGNRKAAVKYMQMLIKGTDYAKFADQAEEFMQNFPGDEFTQTEVLEAFAQFESWCLSKNVFHSYESELTDSFMLEREDDRGSASERLQKLIGLDSVKEQIEGIFRKDVIEKERKKHRGKDYDVSTMHMIFAGNPGTAKTTVAKLFAEAAREKGVLKSGAFVMCGGMDLDGLCCVYAIRNAFRAAKGGVLFIDEAYSLKSDTAITALIQEMENHRDEVIVVLAGYGSSMREFLEYNDGLKSRIPYWVEFPDYSADELTDIFKLMVKERGFTATDAAVSEAHYIFEQARFLDNFGNGRYVRNLIDNALQHQASRLLPEGVNAADLPESELFLITEEDIPKTASFLETKEDLSKACKGSGDKHLEKSAWKELDNMIGLASVKSVIRKAVAKYRLNKLCAERGREKGNASLHMVFTGNPGTAKTTVARLFAEILKEERILPTGNFVEVGRAELVGQYSGHTAPLVKKRFREAQGGVLFIDEAYSLVGGSERDFGDEAIDTIVREMENHRDDVIVIFAGYPEPMKEFLERNPGMKSRIAFEVRFEDYTTAELMDITKLMLQKMQMSATDAAMEKLQARYEAAGTREDFGNGRFVRKTLEEAEMNLAERALSFNEEEITLEMISTIDACDVPEPVIMPEEHRKARIGFAV